MDTRLARTDNLFSLTLAMVQRHQEDLRREVLDDRAAQSYVSCAPRTRRFRFLEAMRRQACARFMVANAR